MNNDDFKFMKYALKLAEKGRGFTKLNPLVGAVVVKDNRIISTGFHKAYGEKHAERVALESINEEDATLYVTLEPCVHYGKTPPCVDLIIEKKLKRVVIASIDENPVVKNKGVEKLRKNGIEVEVGLMDEENHLINKVYFKHITTKKPYVSIHAGISIDGKLTDKNKNSKWITSDILRDISHGLRGEFDSILVGKNTVLSDNPQLTIRHDFWKSKDFYRVVLNKDNDLEKYLNIFKNQDKFPLVIFSSNKLTKKEKKVENHFFINEDDAGLDLKEILRILYGLDISSVLVEGGGKIIDSFIKKRLFDEVVFFISDKIIGGKESVEIFKTGFLLDKSIKFKDYSLINIGEGFIFRGYL